MTANSRQVGGSHYASPFQHWDFVMKLLSNRYLEGQITRYLSRARKKNGLQDYDKSLHYVEKLREETIHLRVAPQSRLWTTHHDVLLQQFVDENELNPYEASATQICCTWVSLKDIDDIALNIRGARAQLERELNAAKRRAQDDGPSYEGRDTLFRGDDTNGVGC